MFCVLCRGDCLRTFWIGTTFLPHRFRGPVDVIACVGGVDAGMRGGVNGMGFLRFRFGRSARVGGVVAMEGCLRFRVARSADFGGVDMMWCCFRIICPEGCGRSRRSGYDRRRLSHSSCWNGRRRRNTRTLITELFHCQEARRKNENEQSASWNNMQMPVYGCAPIGFSKRMHEWSCSKTDAYAFDATTNEHVTSLNACAWAFLEMHACARSFLAYAFTVIYATHERIRVRAFIYTYTDEERESGEYCSMYMWCRTKTNTIGLIT